jgi:hypothetical protein
MPQQSSVPVPVEEAVEAWLGHHDGLAPGVVEGLYLVGSVALGDWTSHSDVDIVAFTADPTDAYVVAGLEAAHLAYRDEAGRPTVDGPFLSWADVGSPPLAAQRAWSLDGEFRFDGECFEINPVTWYTLAEHGVTVRGPAPDSIDVYVDDTDRRMFVRENVDTYWRGVRDEIAGVLEQAPDRQEFGADWVEWCVLGVARMWFTAATGGVASKRDAGEWAVGRLPTSADVFDLAARIRAGSGPEAVDRTAVVATVAVMDAMIAAIV